MDQYIISNLTKRAPNQLAQGEGGKVVLAEQGDKWSLEPLLSTIPQDIRGIVAPNLGPLQALAELIPVFDACNTESPYAGELRVQLAGEKKFPWVFNDQGDGSVFTITVLPDAIPDGITFPSGGQVYIVWDVDTVKWQWSGGIIPQAPANATWVLTKVENEEPVAEQVKIITLTRQGQSQITQGEDGKVVLSADGDVWTLENLNNNDGLEAKAIIAPKLGMLQVLANLVPIFETGDNPSRTGELRLKAAGEDRFPWVFTEENGSFTISALPSAVPNEILLPPPHPGNVYIMFEGLEVKWAYAVTREPVPINFRWTVVQVEKPVERVKFITLTRQGPSQIKQAEDGKVILAEDGDVWTLDKVENTGGVEAKAIIAPRLGMLQVLANLVPIFETGTNPPRTGELRVKAAGEDRFPWVFTEENGSFTISALSSAVPHEILFPPPHPGSVYIMFEGLEVKWAYAVSREPVPINFRWTIVQVPAVEEPAVPEEPIVEGQYTIYTLTKQLPNQLGADSDKVVLSETAVNWYLEPVKSDVGDTWGIIAPSIGALPVLGEAVPVFDACGGSSGEVKLQPAGDAKFPWVFTKADNFFKISVPSSRVPTHIKVPDGGEVSLVGTGNTVKWQVMEKANAGTTWVLDKLNTESG